MYRTTYADYEPETIGAAYDGTCAIVGLLRCEQEGK